MRRLAVLALFALIFAVALFGQQSATPRPCHGPAAPGAATLAKTAPPPDPAPPSNADFIKAADEVLAQMSKLLDLPIKEPLKKSLRSNRKFAIIWSAKRRKIATTRNATPTTKPSKLSV